MRVAIFFDGKNFYSGYRSTVGPANLRLDFPALATWLVARVEGTRLWGAHYYTGIERGEAAETPAQQGLAKFLRMLEVQPGFFVYRFDRKAAYRPCPNCGQEVTFTHEKEVDTTMVAQMLRLAAVDGFDILVLVSGDADLAPAVENVRDLGKKVFVATWGTTSLASRLRRAAFDHIDLRDGLEAFRGEPPVATIAVEAVAKSTLVTTAVAEVIDLARPTPATQAVHDPPAAMLEELALAERKFAAGYVGVNYFLRNWRSNQLDPTPEVRQHLLDALVDEGLVEVYDAPDGNKAMRRAKLAPSG